MIPRSYGPSLRNAAVAFLSLGLLVALAGPLEARKLAVRKMPDAWAEARGRAADGESERVDQITRARTRFESVPVEARHGHLQLGGTPRPLFERRDLEVRPGIGRGGPTDTTVIKIAVIRVEFQTDRLGPQTTGDGRFLRAPDPEYWIDPAPHDDAYFAAHVEAVSRYWASMTYGRVRFEGTVFPRNQQFGSYLLTDMADYGPRSEDELFSIEGLTNYSRESLIAADADPDLVWSDYDIYFVVHAGSDWQNDVFGDTPYDLPTFSIAFSDSDVVVTDEGDTLTTMITYPETSSQDGFLVALNGGIAHEMGHQLGLLDIYNVETFAPTVAFYDVMDSGNLASVFVPAPSDGELTEVIGVLPTCPGAWSRWLVTFQLGIDPFEVTGDLPRARLRAIQSRDGALPPNTQKWYRVPLSDAEYFMIENRVDDLDGRNPDGSFNTALDQDDATGVVLGPIVDDTEEISHNYDLLVDPGVLIWHVDERQALANLSQGRGVNVLYDKRAVTIEEADGIVDIGSPYSLFPLGTDKEAFHADNNGWFTPDTRPNSDSNLGTPSGISIANIGARDTTVTMDILLSSQPRGWPAEVGPYGTAGATATTVADVDGDGEQEIAASGFDAAWIFRYEDTDGSGSPDPAGNWPAPAAGSLLGTPEWTQALGDLDGDGSLELIASTDSGAVYCWSNDGTPHADADSSGLLTRFPAPNGLAWSPTPADLDGDGIDELYAVTRDGYLRGWDVVTALTERFPPRPLLGTDVDSVAVLNATLAFGDLDDDLVLDGLVSYVRSDSVQIQRFDASGRRILRQGWPVPDSLGTSEQTRVWIGLADLDRRAGINDLEIVLALRPGWINVVVATGAQVPGWPRQVLGPIGGPPAFGDLDGDGLLEIALTSNARSVHAFNYNGTQMPGWPVFPRLADAPPSLRPPSAPVIADVDGDGRSEVVAGFSDFTIRAISPDGTEAAGFPIPAGAPVISPPAIADVNGDGRLDLFVQALDGNVYGRILRGLVGPRNPQWPMYGGGPALHGAFDPARLPQLAAAATTVLEGPLVVFPNPIRATDSEVRIRYSLGPQLAEATRVDISLYNVAGERVRSLQGTIFPNTENVVSFPSQELESGVYICSLRARSGDRIETATDKFAVIR